MTKVFSNFSYKNTQRRHFWLQIKAILFSCNNLHLDNFQGVDFKNENSFLKFYGKNLRIFCTKLCNKANLRVLISNMTIAFQNCYPKRLNKAFLITSLGLFVFSINFGVKQIPGY